MTPSSADAAILFINAKPPGSLAFMIPSHDDEFKFAFPDAHSYIAGAFSSYQRSKQEKEEARRGGIKIDPFSKWSQRMEESRRENWDAGMLSEKSIVTMRSLDTFKRSGSRAANDFKLKHGSRGWYLNVPDDVDDKDMTLKYFRIPQDPDVDEAAVFSSPDVSTMSLDKMNLSFDGSGFNGLIDDLNIYNGSSEIKFSLLVEKLTSTRHAPPSYLVRSTIVDNWESNDRTLDEKDFFVSSTADAYARSGKIDPEMIKDMFKDPDLEKSFKSSVRTKGALDDLDDAIVLANIDDLLARETVISRRWMSSQSNARKALIPEIDAIYADMEKIIDDSSPSFVMKRLLDSKFFNNDEKKKIMVPKIFMQTMIGLFYNALNKEDGKPIEIFASGLSKIVSENNARNKSKERGSNYYVNHVDIDKDIKNTASRSFVDAWRSGMLVQDEIFKKKFSAYMNDELLTMQVGKIARTHFSIPHW